MARKPTPKPEPTPLAEAADLFAANAERIEQTILDATLGIRVALKVQKSRLLRGESELEVEDAAGETWYVYVAAPNTSLLKYVAQDLRGRPGAKETAVKATTLVIKAAVPGHDAEVDAYLRTLPPEKLAKFGLDAPTLARIRDG